MQRRAVILQLGQLGGALLVLDLAQLYDPSAGCVSKPAGSLAESIERRGNAAITLGGDLAWYSEDQGLVAPPNADTVLIVDPIDGTRPANAAWLPVHVKLSVMKPPAGYAFL